MNPVIQISDGSSSGSSAKGRGKSVVALAGKKEFDILLSMLGSAVNDGASSTSHSKTGKGDAATGKRPDAKSSGSEAPHKKNSSSKIEEQLLAAMVSAREPAKRHGSTAVGSESASKQATAGLPIVIQDQPAEKSAGKSASPAGSDHATTRKAPAILDGVEQAITSAVKTDNAASGTEKKARPTDVRGGEQGGTVPAKPAPAAKSNVEPDLLKLMTAASSGKVDGKTLRELNGLLAKIDGEKGGSAKEIAPKVKAGPEVSSARESTSTTQSAQGSTGRFDLKPKIAPREDPAGTVTPGSKTSAGSAAVDQVKQADGGAASAVQNGNSGDSKAVSGTQGNSGSSQAAPKQSVQVQPGQLDQKSGSFNDSGRNQADMSKTGTMQNNTFAANNTVANSSFTQTLSAAQPTVPNTPAAPNLQQLAQGIVKQVSMMTLQGKKIVNVKLQPESLGSVTLQVVSDGGKISAQFNVRNADARAFLEASAPQMKQMLETNGVTLAHLNVNLSGGEFQSGNPRREYKPGKRQMKYFSDAIDSVGPEVPPEVSRSFGYNTMEMQV